MEGIDILKTAVKALDDKKGQDIRVIKVTDVSVIADYFVIATATSSTHVKALAGATEDALSEIGVEPHHIEGRTTGWILLDYGTVIIHVMDSKNRDFYELERTWNDGEEVDLSKIISSGTV